MLLGVVLSLLFNDMAGAQIIVANPTNHEFFSVQMSGDFVAPETYSTNTAYVAVQYDYLTEIGTNFVGPGSFPFIEFTNLGRIYTNETVVSWRCKLATNFAAVGCAIYGPAKPGHLGALQFDLGQPAIATNILTVVTWPEGAWSITNYSLDYIASFSFTPEQMHQLEAGSFYLQVASSNFPSGEMRAQISKQPVLSLPRLADNGARSFKVSKLLSSECHIEVSTNMFDWSALTNVNSSEWISAVTDSDATNSPRRYYRAWTPPPPPVITTP